MTMGTWRVSLVAQMIKNLTTMQETQVWSLGGEDPLEKEMATHSSILAWEIPWTGEPGGLQSLGSQKVGHYWVTNIHTWELERTKTGLYHLLANAIFTLSFKIKLTLLFVSECAHYKKFEKWKLKESRPISHYLETFWTNFLPVFFLCMVSPWFC